MASDQFNWDIIVRLVLQGGAEGKKALEEVARSINTGEKASEALSRAVVKAERALQGMGSAASGSVRGLNSLADAELKLANASARRSHAESQLGSGRNSVAARDWDQQAAALGGLTLAADQASNNLPKLRYALYDVSSSLAFAGAAMTGVSLAAVGMSISMDRAFADVIRTTETFGSAADQAAGLREEFERLFTSMPTSWADLTNIGSLAGQLNIARDSVAEFTELVAMFAATTDVSIEQSATAFGRLSQLLNVPADELKNLGSSILAVGVNSIATESQIIAISTQITSMAATAGFTADQVFGLASALASLGTQPELSRGVVTRLFSNITVAINDGSDRLEAFGRVAGMTGDEFARAWGDNASQALLSLVQGLGSVEQTKAVATLGELGVTAARDVPTILRLAQNSEVLAESLGVAAQGYAEGTALQEQYSVITSTVAEKLNILVNNFQNLVATAGEASGSLGFVIDAAIGLTKAFTDLIDNPVAATILGIVVAGTALTGIISLLGALLIRGVAGLIAFRTVATELGASGFTASAGLSAMTASLTGVTASSTAATAATRGLGIAFKSIPVIGLVLAGASIAFDLFAEASKNATDRAEDFLGSLDGLSSAIAQDTAIWKESGTAISTFQVGVEAAAQETDNSGQAVRTWLNLQGEIPGAVDGATSAITNQTYALGENADALLRNALASTDAITELATDPELLQAASMVGFNINDAITAALSGEEQWNTYREELEARISETMGAASEAVDPLTGEFLDPAIESVDRLGSTLGTVLDGIGNYASAARDTAATNEYLTDSTQASAEGMQAMSDASFEALKGLYEIENAALDLQNSVFGLGQSLAENGSAWDYFSESGRANMGALMDVMNAIAAQTPGDAAATASALQGLFNFIVEGGYASASQLGVLQNAISTLSGGAKVLPTAFNPQSFFGGWSAGAEKAAKSTNRAGDSASKAAKQVRTLVDYGNDLQKVFSRAFYLRFETSSTLDDITSSFISMREASEEAARNIVKLKAEIQGLQSDLNIQKIFLGIALEYGDTARAEAIQANIAKLQADLADKTANLSDEQSKNSKELTGNSKAALANRKQMEDLVKQYQEHLVALASSGLGQAELARRSQQLREEFIQQATQLGFSRAEVERYAAAFDDLTTIINRVPRNITVTANADPALQALNEFIAQARSTVGSGINIPITSSFNDEAVKKQARATELQARIANLSMQFQANGNKSTLELIQRLTQQLNSGNYASGGFTGRGGKYEPAGVVHRGEYVVPKEQVNQRTGLPYADAMGRLQRGAGGPGYAGGGFVRGAGSGMGGVGQIASLGPMAMQQFGQLFDMYAKTYLDGRVIADSSSRQYAQSTRVGAS